MTGTPTPMGDVPIVEVAVIDVSYEALRRLRPDLPSPDYRFHVVAPTGAETTFHAETTAADVIAYFQREGWLK